MKSFLIAAGLAVLASVLMVVSACHPHAGDSCYIMQGMSPYIAGALLIVLWPLVAGLLVMIRAFKKPPPNTGA